MLQHPLHEVPPDLSPFPFFLPIPQCLVTFVRVVIELHPLKTPSISMLLGTMSIRRMLSPLEYISKMLRA
jgi:hypothetical protein